MFRALWNPRGDNRTTGVTWGQRLGEPTCPYLRRWVLNISRVGSIRLHHWYSSDDPRALHDHAWWFLTLVLKGGYYDVTGEQLWTENGVLVQDYDHDRLRVGSVRHRAAHHAHSVVV